VRTFSAPCAVTDTSNWIDTGIALISTSDTNTTLRASLGLPRHPVQIVATLRGLSFESLIFNVPEVLKNFFRLAADKGVVIHILPSNNLVDHGFYMFSPTLFQDYYSANRWRILSHYFFQHYPNYKARWKIYRYKPGGLSAFAFSGMMNRTMCSTYFAAQKQPDTTGDANVQQGMYLTAWTKKGDDGDSASKSGWPALRERLKPYVPGSLVPFLMALEARMQKIGGISRYLEHYKDL